MRSTKFVWFLAALSVMLLGIGVGEYAHLGSTSSPSSVTSAIRAVSPTVRTAAPQSTVPAQTVPFTELGPKPTLPEQTVPLTAPAPKPTAPKQTVPVTRLGPNPTVPEQTVPLTAPAPKPTAPKQTVPSTAPAQRAPTTSTSRTGLPLRTHGSRQGPGAAHEHGSRQEPGAAHEHGSRQEPGAAHEHGFITWRQRRPWRQGDPYSPAGQDRRPEQRRWPRRTTTEGDAPATPRDCNTWPDRPGVCRQNP